jgi:D-beta-D-heptose 7-phosphate kinase / D-beta-D-heptose 1-phosphate adenosyltransferase
MKMLASQVERTRRDQSQRYYDWAMSDLFSRMNAWKPFTALVVGDFILDEMVYGDAERLSPDAPVPVLLVKRRDVMPGGAANVCMDLAALRGRVIAFGVVGTDSTARNMRDALTQAGIDASGLIEDGSRPTTLKQNLIGLAQSRHPQKMFRVDEESREPICDATQNKLLAAFEKQLASADVVILEDYAKGVCTPELCQRIIALSRDAKKPVFVDPARGVDPLRYKGATTITPNRTEAELAAGVPTSKENDAAHNAALAKRLLDLLDLQCVVLTLDRHGALLLGREGSREAAPICIPTQAREVYDVSGAGDMFLAGLAAARANGCAWDDSVRFANAAAGLEVEVFGVQPIPFENVRDSVLRLAGMSRPGKLRTWDELAAEVADAKRRKKRVVFTNGCFDVLHSGHVTLLEKAAAFGDFLVVGLNSDESVRRLKGPTRPVNNETDRARVLGALESVAAVAIFTQDTPLDLIRVVRPDTLVKGADYTKDKVVGTDVVEGYGGRVELVDLVAGKSTTATLARM